MKFTQAACPTSKKQHRNNEEEEETQHTHIHTHEGGLLIVYKVRLKSILEKTHKSSNQ